MEKLISFGGFLLILGLILSIGCGAVALKGHCDSVLLLTGLLAFALGGLIVFYWVHRRFRRRWRKKRATGGGVYA